jgi:arylsulfatase A-like enzyme
MLEKINLKESIVFYTSDHGQNILESEDLSRPHCNSENVVKNELSVPLFVYTEEAKTLFPKVKDTFYSQIQIFPTTLSLLGYSDELVFKYGKTISEGFSKSNDRQYILSSSKETKVYK